MLMETETQQGNRRENEGHIRPKAEQIVLYLRLREREGDRESEGRREERKRKRRRGRESKREREHMCKRVGK